MPVHVVSSRSSKGRPASNSPHPRTPPSTPLDQPRRCLTIGLVNNMQEAAFKATERQFIALLEAVSEGIQVRLSLYTFPSAPGTASGEDHTANRYSSVETLLNSHKASHTRLNGLIVTGREPLAANLRDEPYWRSFTEMLEWARENTDSTVWSCLAAHAAVLHTDGIARRKRDDKHFGVFACAPVSQHWLTAGETAFRVPHSRRNGLAEEDLTAHGYSVLTRTADAEVDTFVKQEKSLFVFFQGHPEYESDTLLREYRRDAGRFLRGEASTHPSIPQHYFGRSAESTLTVLRERAIASRNEALLAGVAVALEKTTIENTWHSTATRIYRNWLEYLCERKSATPSCDTYPQRYNV